jgi:hypothetical protein
MRKHKLVFICGKYRDISIEKTIGNLLQAEVMGSLLIGEGIIPIMPMTSFPHSDIIPLFLNFTDEDWLEKYLKPLISICDALIRLGNWEKSKVAPKEVEYADSLGLIVVDSIPELLYNFTKQIKT